MNAPAHPLQRDLDMVESVLADVEDDHLYGHDARLAFDRIAAVVLAVEPAAANAALEPRL